MSASFESSMPEIEGFPSSRVLRVSLQQKERHCCVYVGNNGFKNPLKITEELAVNDLGARHLTGN